MVLTNQEIKERENMLLLLASDYVKSEYIHGNKNADLNENLIVYIKKVASSEIDFSNLEEFDKIKIEMQKLVKN